MYKKSVLNIQKKKFLLSEGNEWFKRNQTAYDNYDFKKDNLIKTISEIYKKKNLKNNTKILEIGCGDGSRLEYLAKNLKIKKIYGIDPSKMAVKKAISKGVLAKIGTADYLPFENKKFDDNELLDKKYFTDKNYRKIRKKLIVDIINARINEIMDLVFSKNINLQSFKKNNIKTYIMIKDKLILNKFQKVIASFLLQNINIDLNFIDQLATDLSIVNTSNLSIFGWKKEAIPMVNTKKSLIAKIFKSIFG